MTPNFEAIADQILSAVDYDIYKEDMEMDNEIRDTIEHILRLHFNGFEDK